MKINQAFKVRTDVQAGRHGFPDPQPQQGYYPPSPYGGQYGWWWVQNGYIARPGRPLKAFGGWYYGPSPTFYYPGGMYGGSGDGMLGASGGGEPGDGTMAPPAP